MGTKTKDGHTNLRWPPKFKMATKFIERPPSFMMATKIQDGPQNSSSPQYFMMVTKIQDGCQNFSWPTKFEMATKTSRLPYNSTQQVRKNQLIVN